MAKPQIKPTLPSSFELLSLRIQKILSGPSVQKRMSVVIRRTTDECPKDWTQLLEDIATTEYVTLNPENEDGVRISWRLPANI